MQPGRPQRSFRHSKSRLAEAIKLRGVAVLAMVDHLAGSFALYLVTGSNRFFISAAEIFPIVLCCVAVVDGVPMGGPVALFDQRRVRIEATI